jgi:uncharacterized protein
MIVKLVVLLVLIWLGFRLYNLIQKKPSNSSAKTIVQDMVCCEKCGIHIPVDEALKNGDKYFCSKDHLPKRD